MEEKVIEATKIKDEKGKLNGDSDAATSSKVQKSPIKRTRRQTRSQTRQSQPQTSKENPEENTRTDPEITVQSDDLETLGCIVVEQAELRQPETKKKTPRGRAKYMKRKKNEVTYLPRANNAPSYEASWSELDKKRLLIGLQRFGVLEIDKLLKSVPGKSEEDIKKFINLRWKMARGELRTHLKEVRKSKGEKSRYLGPVDKWIELLDKFFPNKDHYKSNPIAHAVLLIWKYEKHPDPSECGGIDFKALYEYMYYMLTGYPPRHLNKPTAAYLSETLKNFAYRIKNGNWTEEMAMLSCPLKINTSARLPVVEDDVIAALSFTKDQCLDELSKLSAFNPFSIPLDLLRKKESSTCEATTAATTTTTTTTTAATTTAATNTTTTTAATTTTTN